MKQKVLRSRSRQNNNKSESVSQGLGLIDGPVYQKLDVGKREKVGWREQSGRALVAAYLLISGGSHKAVPRT